MTWVVLGQLYMRLLLSAVDVHVIRRWLVMSGSYSPDFHRFHRENTQTNTTSCDKSCDRPRHECGRILVWMEVNCRRGNYFAAACELCFDDWIGCKWASWDWDLRNIAWYDVSGHIHSRRCRQCYTILGHLGFPTLVISGRDWSSIR